MKPGSLAASETSLIVVDMQNDFCSSGGAFQLAGYNLEDCKRCIGSIGRLLRWAREAGLHIIFTKSTSRPGRAESRKFLPARFKVVSKPKICEEGTWGHEIVPELKPLSKEKVVLKSGYDAFYNTELEEHLRRNGIKVLVITGVTTNACVDTTARAAFIRGFDVLIPRDCTGGYEKDLCDACLENADLLYANVVSSDEIVRSFEPVTVPPRP